jgi:hypothetical protein
VGKDTLKCKYCDNSLAERRRKDRRAEMLNTKIDFNERLEEELENQFPKGDGARGKALVLFAIHRLRLIK